MLTTEGSPLWFQQLRYVIFFLSNDSPASFLFWAQQYRSFLEGGSISGRGFGDLRGWGCSSFFWEGGRGKGCHKKPLRFKTKENLGGFTVANMAFFGKLSSDFFWFGLPPSISPNFSLATDFSTSRAPFLQNFHLQYSTQFFHWDFRKFKCPIFPIFHSRKFTLFFLDFFYHEPPKPNADVWGYFICYNGGGNVQPKKHATKSKTVKCKYCNEERGPNRTRMKDHLEKRHSNKAE